MIMENEAKLKGLTPEQQAEVAKWLFEEGETLRGAEARCQREFKVKVAKSTLGRFYELESVERMKRKIRADAGFELTEGEANFRAVLLTMSRTAIEKAQNPVKAADRRVAVDFTKIMIAARRESHEALRAATLREKFEFDAATACLIHQVKINCIAEDESLDDGQRIQKIREELFGTDLPK
jgi:hypothetical protein